MTSEYKKIRFKPRGWRLIIVDEIQYYWAGGSSLTVARNVETWKKFDISGWYRETEEGKQHCEWDRNGEAPLTPAIVEKAIRWAVANKA